MAKRAKSRKAFHCPECGEKVVGMSLRAHQDSGECFRHLLAQEYQQEGWVKDAKYQEEAEQAYVATEENGVVTVTPVPAPDSYPCTWDGCRFSAKTKGGLASHMRKHEREAKDPAVAPIAVVEQSVEDLLAKAQAHKEAAKAQAEADSHKVETVQGLAGQIEKLQAEIALQQAVFAPYQDKVLIQQLLDMSAVLHERKSLLQKDPGYKRGASIAETLAQKRAQDKAIAEYQVALDNALFEANKAGKERTRWMAFMDGTLFVPNSKGPARSFAEDSYIALQTTLKQCDIAFKDRTWNEIEQSHFILDDVFMSQCNRYMLSGTPEERTIVVEGFEMDPDGNFVPARTEVHGSDKLSLDNSREEFVTMLRRIHHAVFPPWEKGKVKLAQAVVQLGYAALNHTILEQEYVWWEGKPTNSVPQGHVIETAMAAAFRKASVAGDARAEE